MDSFREEQKKECLDGSKNKRGKYGCSCCRKIRDLNEHKKFSRALARARLKNNDKKETSSETEEKDLPETWEDKELRANAFLGFGSSF